jgi:hypothetical protein
MAKKENEDRNGVSQDLGRETRVLLERIYSDIKIITEVLSAHGDKLSKIEDTIRDMPGMKLEIKAISNAVMQISGDLKKTNAKLDAGLLNHETRIVRLEEKVLN